jgi:hypothetical protein
MACLVSRVEITSLSRQILAPCWCQGFCTKCSQSVRGGMDYRAYMYEAYRIDHLGSQENILVVIYNHTRHGISSPNLKGVGP